MLRRKHVFRRFLLQFDACFDAGLVDERQVILGSAAVKVHPVGETFPIHGASRDEDRKDQDQH
jgi:hypothetical protein